ncbi:MAG: hypothetical protein DYG94_03900 [Leptolyngbya sp. PLA3]|nr:MAG: hypothetical protein EDM82_08645 [Cyanobacteria bacterium CYA]MCE7967873.1 hypothetical protein [Leptolyngbya sp. PL-A3]
MNLSSAPIRVEVSAEQDLGTADAAGLDQILQALFQALRGLLADLPPEAQTASGLSRACGVERTTCQRVVSAVISPYPGLGLLEALPGPRGLRTLLEAIKAAGFTLSDGQGLSDCITRLDADIRRLGGSRSGLLRRIAGAAAAASGTPGKEDGSTRQRLFEASAELTGRWSDLWLASHVYTPGPSPDRLIQSRVHGLVGHRARPDAVPLTFHVFSTEARPEHSEEVGVYRSLVEGAPDAILRAFSTQPLPVVRSKEPGEHMVQTIDREPGAPEAEPIDLIFGMRGLMTHPASRPNRLEEVWALVNFPVRRMLFDVFLHRTLARQCLPGLDQHLWRPDFSTQVGERWQTRFAYPVRLELLSPGNARSDAYERYPLLLGLMFESGGLNPADYVGYRCDVTYPAWRTGYRMSFDFGGED